MNPLNRKIKPKENNREIFCIQWRKRLIEQGVNKQHFISLKGNLKQQEGKRKKEK